MKKISILIVFALLLFTGQAQKSRLRIIAEAFGHSPLSMSPNGRYVVGGVSTSGFVYDCVLDTVELYNALLTGVSNNKTLQGNVTYPEGGLNGTERVSIYDNVNKRWRKCAILPEMEGKGSYLSSSSGYGMSEDGKTSTGMIYKILDDGKQSAYLGAVWEDTVLKTVLYPFFPEVTEIYGARPTGISRDGKTVVGFGSRPKFTGGQRTPHYWRNDSAFFLGNDTTYAGEINGYNGVLNRFYGKMSNLATIWENASSRIVVPPLPGWERSTFYGLTDNGLAVGFCQGSNPGERVSFLWSKEMGSVYLKDYCEELYNIDLKGFDVLSIMGITPDGRVLHGWGPYNGDVVPFVIYFDSVTVNSRPLSLIAKHKKETTHVDLSWKLPMYNGREILGYNVYRDSVKINTSLIKDLKYTDSTAPLGTPTYAVTAEYATGESKFSPKAKVQVVGPNECYSVKYLYSELIYNKTHKFHWGLPTSQMINYNKNNASSSLSQNTTDREIHLDFSDFNKNEIATLAPKYTNSEFDFIDVKTIETPKIVSIIKIGDYYYGGTYANSFIHKYNSQWELEKVIAIEGLPPVIRFQQVEDRVFVICDTEFGNGSIFEIDLENAKIIKEINFQEVLNHFCFIPELDGGNGGFEVGGWGTSNFVKMDGTFIEEGFKLPEETMSTTYYNGKVYVFSSGGKNFTDIIEYDVATKKPTGVTFDLVGTHPEVENLSKYNKYPGSANIIVMEDSTIALAAVIQCQDTLNAVAFLELKSMPGLKGFKVYRNGELFSGDEPIQKRNMTDVLLAPGNYSYQIEAHFENGCVSAKSEPFEVTVVLSEGCLPVKDLTAVESNKDVILSFNIYEEEDYPEGQLLGINIYRNGVQLNDELYPFLKYVDVNPGVGNYVYKIETVYDNHCRSMDSVSIEVTHLGSCEPVEFVYLKSSVKDQSAKTFDVTAEWELPFFEKPFELRHGNGIRAGGMGDPTGGPTYVVIGFDSNQLKMYRDYELVGINLIISANATISPFVLVNDSLMHDAGSIKFSKDEYFDYMLPRPIPVSNAKDINVGYKAEYDANSAPLSHDFGPAVTGYGDLFSTDMKTWYRAKQALGLNANWAIAGIFAKSREVSKANAVTYRPSTNGKIIHEGNAPIKLTSKAAEPKFAPEPIQLQGFNIYRDTVKLNTSGLLKTPSYIDTDLVEGVYNYKIGAIYNNCEEVLSKGKNIRLMHSAIDVAGNKSVKVHPNPTTNGMVTIEGEYSKVDVLDIFGRYVASFKASRELNLSGLSKGLYTLKFTHKDQKISSQKLIIR